MDSAQGDPGITLERVAPFGHPRIKACWRLPEAFRSLHVLLRLLAPRHPPCALSSSAPDPSRARQAARICALLQAMYLLKARPCPGLPSRRRSSVPVRSPVAAGLEPGRRLDQRGAFRCTKRQPGSPRGHTKSAALSAAGCCRTPGTDSRRACVLLHAQAVPSRDARIVGALAILLDRTRRCQPKEWSRGDSNP